MSMVDTQKILTDSEQNTMMDIVYFYYDAYYGHNIHDVFDAEFEISNGFGYYEQKTATFRSPRWGSLMIPFYFDVNGEMYFQLRAIMFSTSDREQFENWLVLTKLAISVGNK